MIVVYDNFAAADENSLVKLGSAAVRAVREGHSELETFYKQ